jgi:hypothetical protein
VVKSSGVRNIASGYVGLFVCSLAFVIHFILKTLICKR